MGRSLQKARCAPPGGGLPGRGAPYLALVLAASAVVTAGAACSKAVLKKLTVHGLDIEVPRGTRLLANHKLALLVDGTRLVVLDRKTGRMTESRVKKTLPVRGVRIFVLEEGDAGFVGLYGNELDRMMGGFSTVLVDVETGDMGPVVMIEDQAPYHHAPNEYTGSLWAGMTAGPEAMGRMQFENMVIHELTHVILMDGRLPPREGSDEYHFSEMAALLSEMAYGHTLVSCERILTFKYFVDLARSMGTGGAAGGDGNWSMFAWEVDGAVGSLMYELRTQDARKIQHFSEGALREAAVRALDGACLERYMQSSWEIIDPGIYSEAVLTL